MMQLMQQWKSALLAALAVAAFFGGVQGASAQTDSREKMLESRFAAADTNHDGKLTKAEAQAGMPRIASHFDEIDTDHAGFITLDQIKAFLAQHKQ